MSIRGQQVSLTFLTILQYIVFGSVILYFGKPFFVPLSFAILISCILYPVCIWLEHRGMKRMTAILLSLTLVLLVLGAIISLLIQQVLSFTEEWMALREKLVQAYDSISLWVSREFEVSRERQTSWLRNAIQESGFNPVRFIQTLFTTGTVSLVLLILIPIYVVLILYHRDRWVEVIFRIFPSQRKERIRAILHLSIKSYYNFIKGMLIVYLIVGLLNSLGLFVLGIPHPVLFGFTASVLTFIPYAGIIIASLLPITIAWVTYNSIWYPLGVIAVFTVVQYLEANVIFPLAVSNRLKINTLVTFAAIVIGGILWGVAGLILFIPFIGIFKMIADRTPALHTWAIFLGGDANEVSPPS
jgi:predicted PurR-regulated permease PerM